MKKTIALMLAMLFAVCAFATTASADETETTTTTTEAADTTTTTTQNAADDDVTDGFDTTTTTEADDDTTTTTEADDDATTTTKADDTTTSTVADVTATLAPGQTSYEGQDQEGSSTTTKKPAAVDTTIPSTGSGIVVPAIALAVLAAGTVAVIKTKKED